MSTDLDVAILGGGMAGSLLARQLRRQQPALRVGLFERERHPARKVGESTVEIGSHYLVRRQGLSRYLYESHLPKNGLRYFFDAAEPVTPFTQMSELGTVNLPFHPAFQIDRLRLEKDLLELCGREGVDVELGTTVADVELGSSGGAHRLTLERRTGSQQRLSARWLVDAGGREGFLARRLALREPESDHRVGSVWGRFEGVADVDQLGDDAFRARVRHTSRYLSTFHFLRPGYWIWMIPLRGGLTSIGVVGAPVRNPRLRTAEGFRRFLDQHRAVRELLSEAKLVDHGSLARIAYGTRRFFHGDRWAVVGEAATAADPLYSPGIDFIALANDSLTELVARDIDGEPTAIAERLELYDRYLRFRHEATMRLYRGLYGMIGSYELMRLKWDFDIASYHNLWVSPFMNGEHLSPAYLRRQLRLRGLVLRVMENFAELFRRVETDLRARGLYYRSNRGVFSYGLENIDFLEEIGLPRSRKRTLLQAASTFNMVRRNALALLGEEPGRDWPLQAFVTRPLA